MRAKLDPLEESNYFRFLRYTLLGVRLVGLDFRCFDLLVLVFVESLLLLFEEAPGLSRLLPNPSTSSLSRKIKSSLVFYVWNLENYRGQYLLLSPVQQMYKTRANTAKRINNTTMPPMISSFQSIRFGSGQNLFVLEASNSNFCQTKTRLIMLKY